MASFIIEGGKRLEGEVVISGSKNASLPIIAASILSGKKTTLYNVPNIHDTQVTLKILKYLGCKVKKTNGKIEIDTKYIQKNDIPDYLMREFNVTRERILQIEAKALRKLRHPSRSKKLRDYM